MASEARRNAEMRREMIKQRIGQLRDEISALEAELRGVSGFLDTLDRYENLKPSETAPMWDGSADHRRTRNPPREEVVEAALSILQKAEAPMSRKRLFEAVSDAGIIIYGKDPEVVFSTMMWREGKEQGRIIRLNRFGYWPSSRPYAPAAYAPGASNN